MSSKKELPLISADTSIREAMGVIDRGALAIALVVDSERRLLGTVTDGDIRRGMLQGLGMDGRISEVMEKNPITVAPATDTQEIRRLFIESTVKQIPVVDSDRRVVDLVVVNDLLAVPLSNPDINDSDKKAVLEVLNTPNLSLGPKVVEFERKIAAFAGRRFAVAVNSGTSALHLIVKSMGLGKGDEVITTPFSFIASSNCLLYENVRPVFVDIDPSTYNIDPKRIEKAIGKRTKAILAVDVFGQPAPYDELAAIADKHGLKLISDCCESLGSEYAGKRAGSFGVAGAFAFYPNKQITTGEGGVVVTDDENIARLCRSYRNQGRAEGGGWLCHERLGYNYRLSEISSALGIAQMDRIEEIVSSRDKVARTYQARLENLADLRLPRIDARVNRMSWFVYVVRLSDRYGQADRNRILSILGRHGIGANNYFQPIHLQPFYVKEFGFKPGDFPITEAVADRTIALPFHNHLEPGTIARVAGVLEEALEEVSASRERERVA